MNDRNTETHLSGVFDINHRLYSTDHDMMQQRLWPRGKGYTTPAGRHKCVKTTRKGRDRSKITVQIGREGQIPDHAVKVNLSRTYTAGEVLPRVNRWSMHGHSRGNEVSNKLTDYVMEKIWTFVPGDCILYPPANCKETV